MNSFDCLLRVGEHLKLIARRCIMVLKLCSCKYHYLLTHRIIIVLWGYLSMYNRMLSVEDRLPWSRHEEFRDLHFCCNILSVTVSPGLGCSIAFKFKL